jgi:hypothetical protein
VCRANVATGNYPDQYNSMIFGGLYVRFGFGSLFLPSDWYARRLENRILIIEENDGTLQSGDWQPNYTSRPGGPLPVGYFMYNMSGTYRYIRGFSKMRSSGPNL